jgi:hypothetical protein
LCFKEVRETKKKMIQKKVISQTIPTFYTSQASDKNDFENSCENFSILTSKAVPLASGTTKSISSTKMEPSIKSVNYFSYQFNSNRGKLNDSSSNNNNSKPSLIQQDNANRSPSQMHHRKSQQSSFQKYVIEKQVRQHFNQKSQQQTQSQSQNHQQDSESNTKYMISKILNGDIEPSSFTNNNVSLNKSMEVSSRLNKMVL